MRFDWRREVAGTTVPSPSCERRRSGSPDATGATPAARRPRRRNIGNSECLSARGPSRRACPLPCRVACRVHRVGGRVLCACVACVTSSGQCVPLQAMLWSAPSLWKCSSAWPAPPARRWVGEALIQKKQADPWKAKVLSVAGPVSKSDWRPQPTCPQRRQSQRLRESVQPSLWHRSRPVAMASDRSIVRHDLHTL